MIDRQKGARIFLAKRKRGMRNVPRKRDETSLEREMRNVLGF
jgi:hypothetical protein